MKGCHIPVVLGLLFTVLIVGPAHASLTKLRVSTVGNKEVVSQDIQQWVRNLLGEKADDEEVPLSTVIETVEEKYQALGYTYVRVWCRMSTDRTTLELAIDEGKIHQTAILGVDAVEAIFYRVDLKFPNNTFQRERFEKALTELRTKYNLQGIYGEVRTNSRKQTMNPFGEAVGERELVVHVMRTASFGWGFNIEFNPQWGLLPGFRTRHKDVMLTGDRLKSRVRIAIPYREYIVQENPTFQWVHGVIGMDYGFPFWGAVQLAPGLDAKTELSRFSREDLGNGFLLTSRTESYATVDYVPSDMVQLALGVGTDVIGNIKLDDRVDPPSDVGVYPGLPLVRYGIRAEFLADFTPSVLREDHHSFIQTTPKISRTKSGRVLRDIEGKAQFVGLFLDNEVNIRARGLFIHGDVQFWDERYLTGSYLRTHFNRAFWVREAGQLAIGSQWGIRGDQFQLGIFHDLAGFKDLSGGRNEWSLANAFGPSVHYLFFGIFSLDVYYGLGFSPAGFGQSFVFSLKRVL